MWQRILYNVLHFQLKPFKISFGRSGDLLETISDILNIWWLTTLVHRKVNLSLILVGTLVSASYLPWTLFGGVLLQYDIFNRYHQGITTVFMSKSEQQKQAKGMIPSQTWSIPTNSSESRNYSEEHPRGSCQSFDCTGTCLCSPLSCSSFSHFFWHSEM